MRIVVDRDRCEGLGMCEAMAHTFFEVDDDEVMHVLDESPAEEHRRHVHAAPPRGRLCSPARCWRSR
jgi:ferredoxin